jgi:magnesium transporter
MAIMHTDLHQPPGSPVYVGPVHDHDVSVFMVQYNSKSFVETPLPPAGVVAPTRKDVVTWIHIDGLHDVDLVERVGSAFALHHLAIEDIVTVDTRAKSESYDGVVVVNVKRLRVLEAGVGDVDDHHITLVLGPHWVLSFVELPEPVFDPVRARLRSGMGRIRSLGPDYLFHALLDAIVDEWRGEVERLEEAVDKLEDRPLERIDDELPELVHALKRQLVMYRRGAMLLRDAVANLARAEGPVRKATLPYLRDLRDHIVEVVEALDSQRDRVQAALDLRLALASHRMNDTMLWLTVITTIFIPLSFLTGLYGMNFDAMPELHMAFGYPVLLSVMAAVAGGQLFYFYRRGWL